MKWFIADLHLDDKRLFGPRKDYFENVPAWSRYILGQIHRYITKADHLYILGDMAHRDLHKWRMKIRTGQAWFLKGNHDPSDAQCTRAFGRQFRHIMGVRLCDGTDCLLSHYPQAFWNKSHHGSYHLYGHCHGQREATLDKWMPQRRSMDVGPETIFQLTGQWRPINEQEIVDHLGPRQGHDPKEFYDQFHRQEGD